MIPGGGERFPYMPCDVAKKLRGKKKKERETSPLEGPVDSLPIQKVAKEEGAM